MNKILLISQFVCRDHRIKRLSFDNAGMVASFRSGQDKRVGDMPRRLPR